MFFYLFKWVGVNAFDRLVLVFIVLFFLKEPWGFTSRRIPNIYILCIVKKPKITNARWSFWSFSSAFVFTLFYILSLFFAIAFFCLNLFQLFRLFFQKLLCFLSFDAFVIIDLFISLFLVLLFFLKFIKRCPSA